jgi:DNA helicase II / ATP-dependent DNA helicase PcrA
MNQTPVFTNEQRALIEATASTYVEACPGAGKTKAIIERFTRRADTDSRRGVALISFTNAVVDEARARCAGRIDLVRSPNFVGTIDSFINHFIVGPILTSQEGRTHSFRGIWKHVPGSQITSNGVPAQVELDWFAFTIDGVATFSMKRVPADRKGMIIGLQSWQVAKLEEAAAKQWKRNIARGVLDAAASRLYLMTYLEDPDIRAYLVELLSSRFYEVIVDEVQDCSKEDVALLQLLLDAGIRLVLVGDPEQAIYGFRGGSATELATLLSKVNQGTRLDGNFRSSPSICSVVDSLRSSSFTDKAVGANAGITHPVRLFRYLKPKDFRPQITAILVEHDTAATDVVLLAHASAKARAYAGAGVAPGSGSSNRLVVLATLFHNIQDETTAPRARVEALNDLESVLHQLTPKDLAELDLDDFLDHIKLSRRAYRERCLRLATSLKPPFEVKPSEFKSELADSSDFQRVMHWTLSGLKVPNGDKWASKPSVAADAHKHSTIHGYKGLEHNAVAMIITERVAGVSADEDGLSQWTSDIAGEARNVLYVGASRAQQLLIIGAHQTVFDEVQANLDRDHVTYTVFSAVP